MKANRIVGLVMLGLASCSQPPKEPPVNPTPAAPGAKKDTRSIGSATMSADGTIKLMLRAEGAGGMVGDALIVYPKSHAKYDTILKHLGGLKPGETKPVPPFPD